MTNPTPLTFPLGRNVNHDPRSRNFEVVPSASTVKTVLHTTHAPVLDQMQVASCHDADTQILTRQGWLPFQDLTVDNEVATVDPVTSALTYEHPVRVVNLPYSGDMITVQNARHDFQVTPDHTMMVRKWDEAARKLSPDYSFVEAESLGWYSGFMESVRYAGTPHDGTYTIPGIPGYKRASQRDDLVVNMQDWLGFLGIYLAEGTMIQRTPKCQNKVQIAAFKDREKTFVRKVMDGLGITPLELRDRFTFENARIYQHLESLGLKGVYAPEKFVPAFVFELPAADITSLLTGHREGDGSQNSRGRWTHYTSSPRLADDLARLIFLSGGSVGISSREPSTSVMKDGRVVVGRHVNFGVRHLSGRPSCIERKKDVAIEHYEGMVYCAEVPTHHTLVTRRNGKVLISGNCTGNALAQCINTDDFTAARLHGLGTPGYLAEGVAVTLYSDATQIGSPDSPYPPNDQGSDGLSVCKAGVNLGYLKEYRHAFSFGDLVLALQDQPVIMGTYWHQSMFNPSSTGFISPGGDTVGGHEYLALGVNTEQQYLTFLNSWSANWGDRGRFYMTFADVQTLLADQGDVTVPVPVVANAPTPTASTHPTTGGHAIAVRQLWTRTKESVRVMGYYGSPGSMRVRAMSLNTAASYDLTEDDFRTHYSFVL
jgi:hypothetical protein